MSGQMRSAALAIVRRLNDHGHQAYLVGGCVRDEMLGRPVKDYDIATSALPEQVQALFERTVPTGLQHGTVTVVSDRVPYEVTTFRREGGYEAFRRPTEVEYIDSLQEDLQRRDFTMNAMALDAEGGLVDPFGGMADLRQGVLRCVGTAEERFREDALRMLRCLRFASEYTLRIEERTWEALRECIGLLQHIAMERCRAELERMLGGADPNRALALLADSGALRHTKAEVELAELDGIPAESWPGLLGIPSSDERLAYLYLRLGVDASGISEDMKRLTYSNAQRDAASRTGAAHEYLSGIAAGGPSEGEAKDAWIRASLRHGADALLRLRQLYALDGPRLLGRRDGEAAGDAPAEGPAFLEAWISQGEAWLEARPAGSLKELRLSGQELVGHLGEKPGPWTGQVLGRLLEETALGHLPNDRERLLEAAEQIYESLQKKGPA
ncbi:CCA tRNA nucleotidyltransferase [Paenibacillus mucilaginosus]|nr:CCA tRNA nucleotidyltransferase [Paenibacillus mucilaginosus]MCG7211201.1 CCA tRNA nucleotidyltransferase [Paenibacillus mucilaginosus]WDM30403.1 CCA tRNA nucleotidyltransferase [Paenibacillus mucilaginosus]